MQSFDCIQALQNLLKPLLDYQEYLRNLLQSLDYNRPPVNSTIIAVQQPPGRKVSKQQQRMLPAEPLIILARTKHILFNHTAIVFTTAQLYRTLFSSALRLLSSLCANLKTSDFGKALSGRNLIIIFDRILQSRKGELPMQNLHLSVL